MNTLHNLFNSLQHFGLGRATTFDRLEVLWPDGRREVFDGGPTDRSIELLTGAGRKP